MFYEIETFILLELAIPDTMDLALEKSLAYFVSKTFLDAKVAKMLDLTR